MRLRNDGTNDGTKDGMNDVGSVRSNFWSPEEVERFFLLVPTRNLLRNYREFEKREYFPKRREISPKKGKKSFD